MLRALLVVLAVGQAHADPVPFAWIAPDSCPDAAAVQLRAEQRFGGAIDGHLHGIEVRVTHERSGFVAEIDARAITVANDVRTLRSRDCTALADAVSVVLARLASEMRAQHVVIAPAPVVAIAPMVPAPTFRTLRSRPAASTVFVVEKPPIRRWGGWMHVLGLSGIGALPQVNLGVELAGFIRRNDRFVGVSVGRWVPQDARIAPGAPGRVEVQLDVLALRGGWSPPELPLRVWGLIEAGTVLGTGMGFDSERTASTPWYALGSGFSVGWPMSDHARLVGTFEIAVPLQRPRFMTESGSSLYQPSVLAARCALGLEVGWP